MEAVLGPSHIVLDGDPAPPPKKEGTAPSIFGPCLLWPNGWMDQDATWYRGRPRLSGHIVLDGDPAPPMGHSPQFSAHVCCAQTAGWIKMPLGTEVDLGPGCIVSDGAQLPPPDRYTAAPSCFRPMSIVAKRSRMSATAEPLYKRLRYRRGPQDARSQMTPCQLLRNCTNKHQLLLTNLRDALHHDKRAANKGGRSA